MEQEQVDRNFKEDNASAQTLFPEFFNRAESPKSMRQKILLVEDDPANLIVISTFLENLGYPHDTASDGKDAIAKAAKNSYALILMDVNLPGMNGLAITGELRRMELKNALARTPIVAMTAHALAEDRARCLEAGMDDYISKPFSEQQLREKAEQYARAGKP